MHDTLPSEMHLWHRLENTVRTVFAGYGFEEIQTPLFEFSGVFQRLGDSSDIISKETSFRVFVPFKWTYLNIRSPKGLEIKDYEIKFNENNFNSVINLKMDSLSISGDESSLGYVIDNFISIF